MSFILDALKKSEERRLLRTEGRAPRQTILDVNGSGSRRWPLWLFLLVLLIALGCGWWLRGLLLQTTTSRQTVVPGPSLPVAPVAPATQSPPAAAPAAAIAASRGDDGRAAPFAPVPVGAVATDGQSSAAAPPRLAAGKPTPPEVRRQDRIPDRPTPAAKPFPDSGSASAAGRDRVPKLTMNLHFYTVNPAQRMVRIDNQIVREGQVLSEGVTLEEITPSGAIFSLAGERFELQRPGGQP